MAYRIKNYHLQLSSAVLQRSEVNPGTLKHHFQPSQSIRGIIPLLALILVMHVGLQSFSLNNRYISLPLIHGWYTYIVGADHTCCIPESNSTGHSHQSLGMVVLLQGLPWYPVSTEPCVWNHLVNDKGQLLDKHHQQFKKHLFCFKVFYSLTILDIWLVMLCTLTNIFLLNNNLFFWCRTETPWQQDSLK